MVYAYSQCLFSILILTPDRFARQAVREWTGLDISGFRRAPSREFEIDMGIDFTKDRWNGIANLLEYSIKKEPKASVRRAKTILDNQLKNWRTEIDCFKRWAYHMWVKNEGLRDMLQRKLDEEKAGIDDVISDSEVCISSLIYAET